MNVTEELLAPVLAADPAGPRITYYDDATGERIELSAVTLANWAAKTGNLLRDELGADAGSRVAVLLPAHWQTAAVLFGIWWIGAEVAWAEPAGADVAFCTADRLAEADAAVGVGEVAVCSLDPFGKPVPDLPVGLTDYATAVRAHGDRIVAAAAAGPALDGRSVADVVAAARDSARDQGLGRADRVLSTLGWDGTDGLVDRLLAVFAAGASLVQVANPDAAALQRRAATEKVTRTLS